MSLRSWDEGATRDGPSIASLALAVAVALSSAAAAIAVAVRAGGGGATEGVYLAALTGSVFSLLAPAAVARDLRGVAPWCVALLVALVAQLSLGDGRLRAASTGTVLALAVAAAWLLATGAVRSAKADARSSYRELSVLAPLAVATQLVARASVVVERGPGALELAKVIFELLGLPLLAVGAAVVLAPRRDEAEGSRAASALLAVVVIAGRFHASLVATLLVFPLVLGALRTGRPALQRIACAAALVALTIARPAPLLLGVAAALVLSTGRAWPAVLLVIAGGSLFVEDPRPWSLVFDEWPALVVVFPAAFAVLFGSGRSAETAAGARHDRSASPLFVLGATLLLALVGLRVLEPRAALVAPALLLAPAALLLPAAPTRRLQELWLALLLAISLAAQALPFLRPVGANGAIDLLGWQGGALWGLALLVLALFVVQVRAASARDGWRSIASNLVPGALALALFAPAARAGLDTRVVYAWPPRTLTAEDARVTVPLGELLPAAIGLDTSLAHSGALPSGQAVAKVRIVTAGQGRTLFERPLRLGIETAEWTAGSPSLPDAPAPPPFLVAVPETGGFFAKQYRARLEVEPATAATAADASYELVIELDSNVTPPLALTVFGVRAYGAARTAERR